jgi:WD40 repeat protein
MNRVLLGHNRRHEAIMSSLEANFPEHPRVFLSYGVRDAALLAEHLHQDLTTRGLVIWQDLQCIRTGWSWTEAIQDGLRSCNVLLAILSPHAVRRSGTPGNPSHTDSVCLDEIEYARFACRIPIVPVKVLPCEVPFVIHRLQYIDFTRWQESKAEYDAGVEIIDAAIKSALRGESREQRWGRLPEPWDFEPFLWEKRRDFTGRQWFFKEIEAWRVDSPEPALLIKGGPGIGKSAIVAALVHDNPSGQVLAYHCCRADTPATLEPASFVRSLAALLTTRLDDYAAMLDDPVIAKALDEADADPATAFESAILSPLHKLQKPDTGCRYLLIDALDEALVRARRPTIVDVLATRLERLPPWLRLVATTRDDPAVLRQLRGLQAKEISPQDERNQEDIRQFLQRRLAETPLHDKASVSSKTDEAIIKQLLKASEGNFLFVVMTLQAIQRGQLTFDQIEDLPPGLGSLYHVFFDRLFEYAGVDFSPSRDILEAVVAAREPLTREQIGAVTGMDFALELPPQLARLAPFVPVRDRRYALFHKSFFEWLTGWDATQDQPVAGPYSVSLKRGYERVADWSWAEYRRGAGATSLYCLRHLPAHLHDAGRDDDARVLLLNFGWLRAKLDATGVIALLADYDPHSDHKDLRTLQHALRLSAHILSQDPAQLASQLLGRIPIEAGGALQTLRHAITEWKGRPWLRPLIPSLTLPGGALLKTLPGHGEQITAVALSGDGRILVSAAGNDLKVWDVEDGKELLTLQGHDDLVTAVSVSADATQVVSASTDRTVKVWVLDTGRELRTLRHRAAVTAVALTPDGRLAVSVSERIARVWDLASGQNITTLRGHRKAIRAVAVTADGQRVVSASEDNTLRIWDAHSGRELCCWQDHLGWARHMAITPDGRWAAHEGAQLTIRVRNLDDGTILHSLSDNMGSTPKDMGRTGRTATPEIVHPDGPQGVGYCVGWRAGGLWSFGFAPLGFGPRILPTRSRRAYGQSRGDGVD